MTKYVNLLSSCPNNYFITLAHWSNILGDKRFTFLLGLTVLYLIGLTAIAPAFFAAVQSREGALLSDPILNVFPVRDVSNFIFSTLYIFTVIAIFNIVPAPIRFLHGLLAYALITTVRFATMYFISLEPPRELVELKDPVLSIFFYGQTPITKDLFFSGHASTLFLLFFFTPQQPLRAILLVASIVLCGLLLIQHIHYSYDVIAAPLFAYGTYKISGIPLKRFADGNV